MNSTFLIVFGIAFIGYNLRKMREENKNRYDQDHPATPTTFKMGKIKPKKIIVKNIKKSSKHPIDK